MKGILLAGGTGSRLAPLTKVTNKHLLPIYKQPMIYYPLQQFARMGITEVLLVSGRRHVGHFLELLGSGREFGLHLRYEIQEEAGGIAQALALAESFVGNDRFAVILGDNIFFDDLTLAVREFENSKEEAHVFLAQVADPRSYGVARFEGESLVDILEKPAVPPSSFAVTGAYLYSADVFKVIRELKPSARGELEISDVNAHYVRKGSLGYSKLSDFWGDCGESIEGMMAVSRVIQDREKMGS